MGASLNYGLKELESNQLGQLRLNPNLKIDSLIQFEFHWSNQNPSTGPPDIPQQ